MKETNHYRCMHCQTIVDAYDGTDSEYIICPKCGNKSFKMKFI